MVETNAGANPGESTQNTGIYTYDTWMRSVGIPVHTGFFIPDLRTAELGWWEDRGCQAAFIQLMGQEGIIEARISEIPPGETLPAFKLSVDEVVYVVQGRGLTSVGGANGSVSKTVEWDKHSLFLLPRNQVHQFSNTSGLQAARLLHYNYLPLAMTTVPDPEFFFNNPYTSLEGMNLSGDEFYSQAREEPARDGIGRRRFIWFGNFFPDLRSWDRLEANTVRGAGGHSVYMQFPGSEMSSHMSVFAPQLYKKAHRHGPGRVIVIPSGEGFSILWEQGKEKIVVPWQEGSAFVPPNRWFHQHFNAGGDRARYLALHPPNQFRGYTDEKVQDLSNDQIEYADEEPWIRAKFEEELASRGLKSLMPEEVYRQKDYQWDYNAPEH
jgi:oxalate decarboxylase/phosphoglucose isomerase-like protein (cupin superfamily)